MALGALQYKPEIQACMRMPEQFRGCRDALCSIACDQ